VKKMSKQEFLANGGFSGVLYDNWQWIAFPATFLAGVAIDRYGGRIIDNWRESGEKRKAFYFVQALKEQGLAFAPAGYAPQPTLQAGIASTLPGVQPPAADEKLYKILENIEHMLKNYGERIARLEGKTETKPKEGS